MLRALSSHIRNADLDRLIFHASDAGAGLGGVGNGYGSTSPFLMSFNGGECSTRGRREVLLKCCVSLLLDNDERAKRMLACWGGVVCRLCRTQLWQTILGSAGIRSADGSFVRDITKGNKHSETDETQAPGLLES